jgi:UDP-4-amino-4,6-dideoxy-N-acetyl-beta-L-altrosamine transaminase
MSPIPYGRQSISDADIQAVVDVLRSDFLTQGPVVPAFEKAVAAHVGAPHAVATCNATAALHIACLALGVGPGDRVWTSPITFVASANCALYCGASVDFVDIDPATYNMSVSQLARKLEEAEKTGTLPKVLIPVHLCGQSCDMAAIYELSRRYRFSIIEDASHAIGGRYGNSAIGSGHYSDITIFSFHPVKIITTGEGGMALTRNSALAKRMELLRSHGITRDASDMTHSPDGAWYYQQVALGFNYRITDMQAALGLSQMANLDAWIARRHQIAARYDAAFAETAVVTPHNIPEAHSAYHLYIIQTQDRDRVFEQLRADGIGVNVHYIPVHLQPYYRMIGFKPGDFPAAESYYSRAVSLPMFAALTDAQQDFVIDKVKRHCR